MKEKNGIFKIKKKMENVTSTAKAITSNTFSIEAILTKNNTTISRRPSNDSNSVHSMDEVIIESDNLKYYKHLFRDKRHSEYIDENKLNGDKSSIIMYGNGNHSHNHNNNNMCMENFNGRRGSLDCFLVNDHHPKGYPNRDEMNRLKMHLDSKQCYYGYNGGETPLDMRRCSGNDSGEKIFRYLGSLLSTKYKCSLNDPIMVCLMQQNN